MAAFISPSALPKRTTGAARFITEQRLGGPTRNIPGGGTVTTSVTTLVNNNPDRVGLLIVNLGSVDIFAWIDNSVSASKGVRLTANGGFVSLDVNDDFTLPAEQWIGITSSGSAAFATLELVSDVVLAPEQHS